MGVRDYKLAIRVRGVGCRVKDLRMHVREKRDHEAGERVSGSWIMVTIFIFEVRSLGLQG